MGWGLVSAHTSGRGRLHANPIAPISVLLPWNTHNEQSFYGSVAPSLNALLNNSDLPLEPRFLPSTRSVAMAQTLQALSVSNNTHSLVLSLGLSFSSGQFL